MPTLWDIERLHPLEVISRRNGIAFTLRGGVAFRRLLAEFHEDGAVAAPDLFDLTPFTSDVDLLHSGPKKMTVGLLDAILHEVQAAECFRWELQPMTSRPSLAEISLSNFIPARLLEITGSTDGMVDPANGADDIARKRFRYVRSPLFKQSQRYQLGRDIEAFSALLYLQTLAEARVPFADVATQPGWAAISAVFKDGIVDPELVPLLQQHAYLRGRLRHLLRAAVAAFPNRKLFIDVALESGLLSFLKHLDGEHSAVPLDLALRAALGLDEAKAYAALAASDRLAGDTYRVEVPPLPWTPKAPPGLTLPKLGENETVLLASPRLKVNSGIAKTASIGSLGHALSQPSAPQEFLHIKLPNGGIPAGNLSSVLKNTPDGNLGAFLMVSDESGDWRPFALPAVVMTGRPPDRSSSDIMIRMNCLGLLAAIGLRAELPAHLILVRSGDQKQ